MKSSRRSKGLSRSWRRQPSGKVQTTTRTLWQKCCWPKSLTSHGQHNRSGNQCRDSGLKPFVTSKAPKNLVRVVLVHSKTRYCTIHYLWHFVDLHKLQWCARVIFVEAELQALRVRVTQKFFRLEWESSHDLVESSHTNCRVTSNHWFPSSSQMKFHISPVYFLLWNGARLVRKWCPTCYEMSPDRLENGAQCCFSKFDRRLFISKFSCYKFIIRRICGVITSPHLFSHFTSSRQSSKVHCSRRHVGTY